MVKMGSVKTTRFKTLIVFLLFASLISCITFPVNAYVISDLWDDPDDSGFDVLDYYDGGIYLGQLHYEWWIRFLDGTGSYDYYAIHVKIDLDPAHWIVQGYTKFDLDSPWQMVCDYLPTISSGSYSYGTSASISSGGGSFSASQGYSAPDTEIDVSLDANWGGYVKWDYTMMTVEAKEDTHTFHFTAITRTGAGGPIDTTVKLYTKWCYWRILPPGWVSVPKTKTLSIYYDGTPGSGGGCPILSVWDGEEYVVEGLLDIHNPEAVDVINTHELLTTPYRTNQRLFLRLTEHNKTISHIDQIYLLGVTPNGHIVCLPLCSAQHSTLGQVRNALLYSDDSKIDLLGADHTEGTSEFVVLQFFYPRFMNFEGFLFVIEGYNPIVK